MVVVHLAVGHRQAAPVEKSQGNHPTGETAPPASGRDERADDDDDPQRLDEPRLRRRLADRGEQLDRVVELAGAVCVRHHLRRARKQVDRHEQIDGGAQHRDPRQRGRSQPPPRDGCRH